MRDKLQHYIYRLQRKALDPTQDKQQRATMLKIKGELQKLVDKDITEQINGLTTKLNVTEAS